MEDKVDMDWNLSLWHSPFKSKLINLYMGLMSVLQVKIKFRLKFFNLG